MTLFKMLTAVCMGLVSGVLLAALGRWKALGFPRILILGALGGTIGGLIGDSTASGPVWGEMQLHPIVALFAFFGGASAVAMVRLLMGEKPARAAAPRAGR